MRHSKKPIWGFGAVGWICLPVLIALIVVVIVGYDLQKGYFELIAWTCGIENLMWYVARWHSGPSLSFDDARFGSIDIIALSVALFVYPRKTPSWAFVLLLVWMLVESNLQFKRWVWDLLIPSWNSMSTFSLDVAFAMTAITTLPAALLLCVLTKSWRVVAAVLVWAAAITCVNNTTIFGSFGWVHWCWHLGFAAIVISWATYHRRNFRQEDECPRCGYSLRGFKPAVCPECGHALTQVTTP